MRRRTSEIDREMNRALRHARTPGEIASIKRDANLARRRALTGARDHGPPADIASLFRSIALPTVEWQAVEEAFRRFADRTREVAEVADELQQSIESQMASPSWLTASERARGFLLAHLKPEQRHTMETLNYFIVRSDKGRDWRIRTAHTTYNVDLLDPRGNVVDTFCGLPGGPLLPRCDVYLAQKLQLETDEGEFLLKANRRLEINWQASFYRAGY